MITGAPSFWKENFLEIPSEESRRGQKGLSKAGVSAGDASAGSHEELWSVSWTRVDPTLRQGGGAFGVSPLARQSLVQAVASLVEECHNLPSKRAFLY